MQRTEVTGNDITGKVVQRRNSALSEQGIIAVLTQIVRHFDISTEYMLHEPLIELHFKVIDDLGCQNHLSFEIENILDEIAVFIPVLLKSGVRGLEHDTLFQREMLKYIICQVGDAFAQLPFIIEMPVLQQMLYLGEQGLVLNIQNVIA